MRVSYRDYTLGGLPSCQVLLSLAAVPNGLTLLHAPPCVRAHLLASASMRANDSLQR